MAPPAAGVLNYHSPIQEAIFLLSPRVRWEKHGGESLRSPCMLISEPRTRGLSLNWKSYNVLVLAGLVIEARLVLAFTVLLQSNSAAAPQPTTQERPAPPRTGQETKPGVEGDLATIIQSRSTNTRGYTIIIRNDGSATAEISSGAGFASGPEPPRTQAFPPGTIDTKTLRRLLTAIGDVSKIPAGSCPKSVSFGTRTQIAYAGKTSGDLQCIGQQAPSGDQARLQASEDLGKFVQATLSELKINDRRVSSNQ
jgi:hypothetical protein